MRFLFIILFNISLIVNVIHSSIVNKDNDQNDRILELETNLKMQQLTNNKMEQLLKEQALINTRLEERLEKQELKNTKLEEKVANYDLTNTKLEERIAKQELTNTKLEERIAKQDLTNTKLEERIAKQELTNTKLEERIEKQELMNTNMKERIKEQESKTTNLEERLDFEEVIRLEIAKLPDTVKQLEQMCNIQEKAVTRENEIDKLQTEIRQLEDKVFHRCRCGDDDDVSSNTTAQADRRRNAQLSNRVTRQTEIVAFSAYADHSFKNLGIDHPIVYNQILLNEGASYNEHSGMFTCPQDGIYVFYFSVSTSQVNQIVAKLVVDGVNKVDSVADTFHTNHEAQGANLVVTSLTKGQQVWVANYRWTTHVMAEDNNNRFATFSGFMLY